MYGLKLRSNSQAERDQVIRGENPGTRLVVFYKGLDKRVTSAGSVEVDMKELLSSRKHYSKLGYNLGIGD